VNETTIRFGTEALHKRKTGKKPGEGKWNKPGEKPSKLEKEIRRAVSWK